MDEKKLSEELHGDGFLQTYVSARGPRHALSRAYARTVTAHIILRGEVTLTMNGRTMTYRAGGRS